MKRLSFIIISLLICLLSAAQTIFTVSAPTSVAVGQKFAVTYRLKNGEGTSLHVGQINGCTEIFGPAVSTFSSYNIVNGQTSSTTVYDYTYTYRADKEGTFTIGEASIVVAGKKMTTRPLKLTIVAGKPTGAHQQQQSSASQSVAIDDINTQSADRPVSNNDVFVRIILSKNTAYEQEAVECTIKLYTKYSISAFFPTKQPSFDGFLIQELNVQPSLNQVEEFNGQRYMTALLKKCIMYPQKSGKLTINSGNYDINVVQYDQVNMGFFTVQNPQERKIKVSSNSVSINIKPLPQPQPEGFSGAVGTFSVKSRLVGNKFKTYEPATLIYDISGTGNIKYIKEPDLDFPSDFEEYTPKKEEKIQVSGNDMTGTVSIEYTFVPTTVGDFTIREGKFVYFDLAKNDYVTLTTPSFDIKVAKGAESARTSKEEIRQHNTDILHIVSGDIPLSKSHGFMIDRWWYWCIFVVLAGGFSAAVLLNRKYLARAADIQGLRLAKANKVARRRLKLARKFLQKNESDKFYEEVLRATWGYLSDKLSMPLSQLNRDNIVAELTAHGVELSTTDKVIALLDECEMARYTPSHSHEQLQTVYEAATSSINQLEKAKIQKN